jgi:hypothetical protein
MRTDLKAHITPVSSLRAASRAGAVNGASVDIANYDAAVVVIDAGAMNNADNIITFEIQDSNDNAAWAPVAAGFLDGAQPVINAANQVVEVGYHGIKRYLRVAITAVAGTGPTLICSAIVVCGKPRTMPA